MRSATDSTSRPPNFKPDTATGRQEVKMDDEDKILKWYSDQQKAAKLEMSDMGLETLAELVHSGAIDIDPKFQRRARWSKTQQSRLIDSIVKNIPIPPVYLAEIEGDYGTYEVIDGKQRLTAIRDFLKSQLELTSLDDNPLNGYKYEEMPQKIQNSLKLKRMRVIIVLQDSSSDLTFKTFTRINTEGEPLTAQEIRNVAFRGPLNDTITDLAKNPFLLRQFKLNDPKSPRYKKMDDVQLVLRALTLADTWQTFSGDLRATMDNYMREHMNEESRWLNDVAKTFNSAMEHAETLWGKEAFHMPGRDQAINGLFDAQIVSLMLRIKEGKSVIPTTSSIAKIRTDFVNTVAKNDEFRKSVREGTNTPRSVIIRIKATLDFLERELS